MKHGITSMLGTDLFPCAAALVIFITTNSLMGQTFQGDYEIVNAGSGMVLEVPAFSTTNGTSLDQWIANDGANQQWTLSSEGSGGYQILNKNSGLAMEVYNQSTASGATVDQWAWWGGANQQWTLSSLSNGCYEILNVNSGLALEVSQASTADGGAIDQSAWTGAANQQWLILATETTGTVSAPSGGSGAAASTFHGFNWADPNDNYVDGPLLLSGLSLTNNYANVQSIAGMVLGAFSGVGANTVRIPINPETVIGSWWATYKGAIDEATSLGMKVIVCPWTGASDGNGMVNDPACFWKMWDTVVTDYNGNGNVYFEILNEPFGYSTANWLNVVTNWLQRYPTVAHGRVLVGGTGYDQNIAAVASADITAGCLFSVHDYGFWNSTNTSSSSWYGSLAGEVGSYAGSTVQTEFGASMNYGWNYAGGSQNNNEIASIIGFSTYCSSNHTGAVYWPGLRDGDSYSMFTRNTNNTALILNSPSGLDLVKYAWSGFNGTGNYQILNGNSGLALEVELAGTTNGGSVSQWVWNGGASQQWTMSSLGNGYYEIMNENSKLALEVSGGSTANGAVIDQWTWNGGNRQQWAVSDLTNGFYRILNRNSGLALEVSAFSTNNGSYVDQWTWNGGANQVWTFGAAATPPVTFSLKPVSSGQIEVQWSQGVLMDATNLLGPWNTNSSGSPLILTPVAPQEFYRQLVQ
ncbi:MAG: RICIN domain-containing protein [Verrucomicrobiota bacterium]